MLTVARKRGAVLGCAAKLGGIAAAASEDLLNSLTRFGTAIGTARNLNTDLRALWPEQNTERNEVQRGRLQSKKKSLAAAHAIENGTPATRRRMGEIFMKRVLGPDDIDEVTSILSETESRSFAENTVQNLIAEAIGEIESTNFSNEDKNSLIESAKLIVRSQ